jgi:hypothetical protein
MMSSVIKSLVTVLGLSVMLALGKAEEPTKHDELKPPISWAEVLKIKPELKKFLTVEMQFQGEGPVRSWSAKDFETPEVLRAKEDQVIFFVRASPPTRQAEYAGETISIVGLLVLVKRDNVHREAWAVIDAVGLEAWGSEAEIQAKGVDYIHHLPDTAGFICIELTKGGRNYNHTESFTYETTEKGFKLLKPHERRLK